MNEIKLVESGEGRNGQITPTWNWEDDVKWVYMKNLELFPQHKFNPRVWDHLILLTTNSAEILDTYLRCSEIGELLSWRHIEQKLLNIFTATSASNGLKNYFDWEPGKK